ncbi:MAG TPA: DUF3566 domain-containing protein [Mycobacterium sp.]|nr:DUF3566 domain-containing protein [Mycobacterium sp.]
MTQPPYPGPHVDGPQGYPGYAPSVAEARHGDRQESSSDFGPATVSGRGLAPGAQTPSQYPGAPTAAAQPPPAAGHYDSPGGSGMSGTAVTGTVTGTDGTRPATSPVPSTESGASRVGRSRGPRRARLQLRHINPWTVLKFSCVLAIALFFVWLIVVGILFGILDAAGVVGKVNDTVTTINGAGSKAPVTPGVVFGGAALVGVINVVLFIALSTVGSIIYNLCADLVGGVEITLSES